MFVDKLKFNNLVSPEEAVTLSKFRTIQDIKICDKIIEELYKVQHNGCKPPIKDEAYFELGQLFAIMWNAGRIQGVREEREKRAQQ